MRCSIICDLLKFHNWHFIIPYIHNLAPNGFEKTKYEEGTCQVFAVTYPLHGNIKVSEVIETHGDPSGCDRRTDNLQQTLHTPQVDELYRKFLVTQQGSQVLQTDRQ